VKKHISKIAIEELSLIGEFKGRKYQPINQESTVLSTKAAPVEERKDKSFLGDLWDSVKKAMTKKAIDVDQIVENAEEWAERTVAYDVLSAIISQMNWDLSMVFSADAFTPEEKQAAVERVLDGFIEALKKVAPKLMAEDDESAEKGKKAGKRHSTEDLAHLQAIKSAHATILKKAGAMQAHIDALDISDTDENNDGAQNKTQEKQDDEPKKKTDSGKGEIVVKAGAVGEDGYPTGFELHTDGAYSATLDDTNGTLIEKAKSSKKPYGDVEYADSEAGKYPIDTEEHVRAAWSYINVAKNYDKLGDKAASVKAKIKSACKKFGIDTSDGGEKDGKATEIRLTADDMKPALDAAVAKALEEITATAKSANDRAEAAEKAVADMQTAAKAAETEKVDKLAEAAQLAQKARASGGVSTMGLDGKMRDPMNGHMVREIPQLDQSATQTDAILNIMHGGDGKRH
jgi:hypothetical protein